MHLYYNRIPAPIQGSNVPNRTDGWDRNNAAHCLVESSHHNHHKLHFLTDNTPIEYNGKPPFGQQICLIMSKQMQTLNFLNW